MNRKVFMLAGVLALALACGGPAAQAADPLPPPQPFGWPDPSRDAIRDLSQADRVWQAVAERTGPDLTPVLRPRELPVDLDKVLLLRAGPGTFAVEYRGLDGRRLTIAAGPVTPPRGELQERRVVRGQPATLQMASAVRPAEGIWLWWREPGFWTTGEPVKATGDEVFYLISAEGLRPDEVETVGQFLTAVS